MNFLDDIQIMGHSVAIAGSAPVLAPTLHSSSMKHTGEGK